MTYKKPLPKVNADSKFFWDGCKEHRLCFQKCRECGHIRWPAAFICPHCLSQNTELTVSEGRGKVYSFVTYHVAYHPEFKNDLPYVVAVVALEEGPHLLTNITGCKPDDVACDMRVKVAWDDITEDFSLPKFQPDP